MNKQQLFGFFGLLIFVSLLIAKLAGVSISWVWVFSPFWLLPVLGITIGVIVLIVAIIMLCVKKII